MTQRFAALSLALAGALLALSACTHDETLAKGPIKLPPFLGHADAGPGEATGAIATTNAKAAEGSKADDSQNSAPGAIDVNQRLAALELDMAALKIELSRVTEFDDRLTALEGGSPYSAAKLAPIAMDPPPPKLRVPKDAGEAPLPEPTAGKAKSATPLPADVPIPASVGALEPVAPAAKADPVKDAAATSAAKVPVPNAVESVAPSPLKGDFALQLAAYSEAEGAAKGWTNLKTEAGPLLADLSPRREEADVAQGKVYRLKAGPFADAAAANQRCQSLQAEGFACMVTKFTGSWP